MKKVIDITRQRFSKLTVLRREASDSTGKTTWLCRCDCGNETVVTGLNLKSGNTASCGCLRSRPVRKDFTNKRFGRLVAVEISRAEKSKIWWKCICDCGRFTEVSVSHLSNGHTRSCGCLLSEISSRNAKINLGGKGVSHPRWRHDITKEQREMLRSDEDKKWAIAILERDDFCCASCQRGGHLHAHHLRGYAEHPELRTALSNGVTLCRECHKKFHQKFGCKGFSDEQFYSIFDLPYPEGVVDLTLDDLPKEGDLGNAVEHIWMADHKGSAIEDLKKSIWYIDREIQRRTKSGNEYTKV